MALRENYIQAVVILARMGGFPRVWILPAARRASRISPVEADAMRIALDPSAIERLANWICSIQFWRPILSGSSHCSRQQRDVKGSKNDGAGNDARRVCAPRQSRLLIVR